MYFSFKSKFQENVDAMQAVFATLKAYNQRISFASGRVEMLQGKKNSFKIFK